MCADPPPEVAAAAATVRNWLDQQAPDGSGRLSDGQVAKLSPAARLDYTRKFDQTTMPAWKDPRAR
jgi:hypothetical protein